MTMKTSQQQPVRATTKAVAPGDDAPIPRRSTIRGRANPTWIVLGIALLTATPIIPASATPADPEVVELKKFSPAVVEKATKFLADAALRQSGKSIQSTAASDVSRAISSLTKQRRALSLETKAWQQASNKIVAVEKEIENNNVQLARINVQLAGVAGRGTRQEVQLVAQNNAIVAMQKTMASQLEKFKQTVLAERAKLNNSEASYASSVLAIRKDLDKLRDEITESLKDKKVITAIKVMSTNFGTPDKVTSDLVLSSVDRRLQKIEESIFSESIDLEVEGGSLYVNVTVGDKTTRMVVDSGASIVSLPMKTAIELGVTPTSSSPKLRLITADGRQIEGRGIVLPKIRVGQFEATNVKAAVLETAASNAEPLLGMSFLSNFKFEIDTAEKSLTLLRVNTD